MRAFILCVAVLMGILAAALPAQQVLDNQAIIKLHNAGLSDDTLLHLINTEPGKYATGVSDIIALKQAGISEKLIKAVATRANPAPPPPAKVVPGPASIPAAATPAVATPAAATPAPAPAPTPVQGPPALAAAQGGGSGSNPQQSAVYYSSEHKWVPLGTETVNWKLGAGKFRAIASAGTVKRDVNGVLGGASSMTTLKSPPHFLLYATQNVAITQYYFVHMRTHSDGREFLAPRQEDFDFRATRDTVPFESKEVESHWFLITLPAMEPGEYGIVPPDVAAASHTADDSAKMYTFRLVP